MTRQELLVAWQNLCLFVSSGSLLYFVAVPHEIIDNVLAVDADKVFYGLNNGLNDMDILVHTPMYHYTTNPDDKMYRFGYELVLECIYDELR